MQVAKNCILITTWLSVWWKMVETAISLVKTTSLFGRTPWNFLFFHQTNEKRHQYCKNVIFSFVKHWLFFFEGKRSSIKNRLIQFKLSRGGAYWNQWEVINFQFCCIDRPKNAIMHYHQLNTISGLDDLLQNPANIWSFGSVNELQNLLFAVAI